MNISIRTLSLVAFFIVAGSVCAFAQTAAAVEKKIKARLANIDKWSNYGPDSDYDKLGQENDLLKKELVQYGKLPATMAYSFPRLKGDMYIVTSRDGRLRIYSWDRQTGGTMHDFDSVFQYRGKSGKLYTWGSDDEEESGGVFYHEMFQLDAASGPIYLAVSTFIGSTSLAGAAINSLTIDGERLNREAKLIRTGSGLQSSVSFAYDFFSVVDRPERPIRLFKFDAAGRAFTFPVVIEDEKTPQGRVTNKLIRYRFNGTHFVKVG